MFFTEDVYQMMMDNDEMWIVWKDGTAMFMLDLPIMDA